MIHSLRSFISHGLKRRSVRNANRQKARRRLFLEVLEDRTVPSPVFTRNGFQSETSIAADDSGKHVVIGFNDLAGFNPNPVSVSGFVASDDGGQTWVTGDLPSPGNQSIGTTRYPQILGDPDVKYLGGSNFIYSSIMIRPFSATTTVETMCVHISRDFGHTWAGPFEVTPATNPNGLVDGSGNPLDSADKEFIDVDPDTGRVLLTWSNFTPVAPSGREISTTYSDDVLSGNPPTWSARKILDTDFVSQSIIPAFAGNSSPNAYVAWRRSISNTERNIAFARSTDNGATWSAPVNIASNFFPPDQVLGNDRIDTFPSMAVDNSIATTQGNIYIVYSNNNNHDGADIAFQRSTDGGLTFSAPIILDSRPGADRAQWFPAVAVDNDDGRVFVFYLDQEVATSGDLTQVTYTYSDDGGLTWQKPQPLSDRPFHAGWGNDTSQPNLGDYNHAIVRHGDLLAAWGGTTRPGNFADGQPSASFTTPDLFFASAGAVKPVGVDLGTITFTDSGGNGFIDPGETVDLQIPLRNYVTNPLNASAATKIVATLSSNTPGVTVVSRTSAYSDLAPGATGINLSNFQIQVSSTFVPGTLIDLTLSITAKGAGSQTLRFSLFTGTPSATTIFSENFDEVAPGTLPAGWTAVHGAGAVTVPWTTNNTFTGSNAAFHSESTGTGFERLFSPLITVPATSDYVTIDMDVQSNTQDDPNFNIQAFDGFFLRITDRTSGRTIRSNLVEAFEDEFTTGSFQGYPKHFPRSGNPAYFQDMSAWAGNSGGILHVHMRLPGMAGSTFQLRFEYTQDATGVAAGVTGVAVDNIVIQNVIATAGTTTPSPLVALVALPAGNAAAVTGVAVDNIVIQNVIATAGTTTPSPLVPLVALPAANLGNTIPNASSSRSGDDGELGSTGTLRAESTFGPPFSDAGKITASQALVGWLALDAVDLMFRDSSVAWWDGISEPF